MPSTYAHYRLGQQVKGNLSGTERVIVNCYSDLFLIGLHGPDLLFYYHPLVSNPINAIGYATHNRTGKDFFSDIVHMISRCKNPYPYLAYCYGFLCHFVLDATCHGYIDEKIQQSGVTHTEIEVDFDRFLMQRDGLDPLRHPLTRHIRDSYQTETVIAKFYPGITPRQIKYSIHSMKFYDRVLLAPSPYKRKAILEILQLSGNYKEMHGLLIGYTVNPQCSDSTKKLWALYKNARKQAIQLIQALSERFAAFEKDGTAIVLDDPFYQYTFSGKRMDPA